MIGHGVELARHQQMNVWLVTATTTLVDVDLTWNYINCRVEFQEEFVSNVDITQQEDIATTAKKVIIGIQKSQLLTARHVRHAIVIQLAHLERYATKLMGSVHVRMALPDGNVTDVQKDISRY